MSNIKHQQSPANDLQGKLQELIGLSTAAELTDKVNELQLTIVKYLQEAGSNVQFFNTLDKIRALNEADLETGYLLGYYVINNMRYAALKAKSVSDDILTVEEQDMLLVLTKIEIKLLSRFLEKGIAFSSLFS
jgi:hypothetical protein